MRGSRLVWLVYAYTKVTGEPGVTSSAGRPACTIPAMVRDPQAPRSPQAPQPPYALADELLAALDPLPYPSRMRELALRARAASAHGQLAGLLEELSERGGYERALAVTAAAVGGRTGYLERRLADPDPVVRGHAL
ncbi:hypothetical protein AB4212_69665, partial [Streptomyces sp. 2MCAF27]